MEINRNAPATAAGDLRIDADPETVFSVIAAIDQWPSWNPDVKSVTLQGPVQPGTVFQWKAGPSTLISTLQVVDPPSEIAWTGTLGGVLGGAAGQPAQGLQPSDPGQGHPKRPRAPQDRGRAAGRDRVSGLRGVPLAVRFLPIVGGVGGQRGLGQSSP